MRKILALLVAAALIGACAMGGDREPAGMDKSRGDAVMADTESAGRPEPVAPRIGSSLAIVEVLAMPHRSEANRARDAYRHPRETLAFLDVQPHQTVVEVTPGGGGWYTEILAPYLRANGTLIAQVFDPSSSEKSRDYYTRTNGEFRAKLAANPEVYDRVRVLEVDVAAPVLGAPASVDRVLTFRNVHNWTAAGNDEANFRAFFEALRSGGVLGVVEHRAKEGTSLEDMKRTGYMTEAYVIRLAERAGFKLAGRSEINANPKDTKDHPNGVWSLPPVLRGGSQDREKFSAIGESDRMTLRFVKP